MKTSSAKQLNSLWSSLGRHEECWDTLRCYHYWVKISVSLTPNLSDVLDESQCLGEERLNFKYGFRDLKLETQCMRDG